MCPFSRDGKPSDFFQNGTTEFDHREYRKVEESLAKTCGMLASRFGRRLTITCIGMADADENFTALEKMTQEAKQFGATATFHQPSLNTDSLSQIISSSVASSLSSKAELTSLQHNDAAANPQGKTFRSVRMDVERERQNTPESQKPSPSQWRIFRESTDQTVISVWTWSDEQHDFANIIDTRCHKCSKPVADANYNILSKGAGEMCKKCKACFFCARCVSVGLLRTHQEEDDCQTCLSGRRNGFLVGSNTITKKSKRKGGRTTFTCPVSYNVAWKKKAFGEGAERLAYKFRFVDPTGKNFVGPVMVAKESRFVEDLLNENAKEDDEGRSTQPRQEQQENYLRSQKHSYHKTFMRTQSIASLFASRFNERIERFLPPDALIHVPRIEFVKPLIYELEDKTGQTHNVLVEPLIEGKYQKFSDNHGDLAVDQKQEQQHGDFGKENKGIDLISAALLLGRKVPTTASTAGSKSYTALNSSRNLLGNHYNALKDEDVDDEDENDVENGGQRDSPQNPGLGMIEEGDEEEDEDDYEDSGEEDEGEQESGSSDDDDDVDEDRQGDCLDFNAASVPDTDYLSAFSHYSYALSRGHLMVVDLQGSLQHSSKTTPIQQQPKQKNKRQRRKKDTKQEQATHQPKQEYCSLVPPPLEDRKRFVLTDPAIHQRHRNRSYHFSNLQKKRRQFGRTDLGGRGTRAFFQSHECNEVCRLLRLVRDKKKKTTEQRHDDNVDKDKEGPIG